MLVTGSTSWLIHLLPESNDSGSRYKLWNLSHNHSSLPNILIQLYSHQIIL
jgi:hypothetical protein